MNINWQVRLRNPQFIIAIVSAILLAAEQIVKPFGIELDASISEQVLDALRAVLSILTLTGVMIDPTTAGLSDSNQALGYTEPKEG